MPAWKINPHSQYLYSDITSPIKRVKIITQYVAVKVVSCTAEILLMEGMIYIQWGDLNLRQVII